MQLDTHRDKQALEIGEQARVATYRPRAHTVAEAERGQDTSRLADVPFHRMEPVAAIGDMGDAQALSGGEQVVQPPRKQCAQRDLKRIGRDVKVTASRRTGVKIDSIAADADGVRKSLGAIRAWLSGLHTYVSFQDCELSRDSAAFPHVRRRR